ncbi:MAG: ester cyclase [Acidimicrobiales bacterium]
MYDLINAGDIDGFRDLLAADFVEHEAVPGLAPTRDGVKDFFRMQRAAFPDLRMDVEDVYASGEKAVARVRYSGTNKGPFMAMAATDKSVDVQLIDMFRLGDDGLAHEHWGVIDMRAMMQQLSAIPTGPSA